MIPNIAPGIATLALSWFIGSTFPGAAAAAPAAADASTVCPTVTPLHGLLPF